jgi:glyoxylase-like metal-dependent hydrolase (beta-lactamase superfamily II)
MTSFNTSLILSTMVVGPLATNTYIVGSQSSGQCLLIDPGAEANTIIAKVNELNLNVTYIINTHGHGDHNGAVRTIKNLTGAEYGINDKDIQVLGTSALWAPSIFPEYERPPNPDFYIRDAVPIEFTGVRLEVLETPGHTPGSVCFYAQGLLFTGDTLFKNSIGRYDIDGGNREQLIDSIRSKLFTLPPETVIMPGHGPQSTIETEINHNPFL